MDALIAVLLVLIRLKRQSCSKVLIFGKSKDELYFIYCMKLKDKLRECSVLCRGFRQVWKKCCNQRNGMVLNDYFHK